MEVEFDNSPFGRAVSGPPELIGKRLGAETPLPVLHDFAKRMMHATDGSGPAKRQIVQLLAEDWSERGWAQGAALKSIDLAFQYIEDGKYWGDEDSWVDSVELLFNEIRLAEPSLSASLHVKALSSRVSGVRHFAALSLIRAHTDREQIESERDYANKRRESGKLYEDEASTEQDAADDQ